MLNRTAFLSSTSLVFQEHTFLDEQVLRQQYQTHGLKILQDTCYDDTVKEHDKEFKVELVCEG